MYYLRTGAILAPMLRRPIPILCSTSRATRAQPFYLRKITLPAAHRVNTPPGLFGIMASAASLHPVYLTFSITTASTMACRPYHLTKCLSDHTPQKPRLRGDILYRFTLAHNR